MEEQKIEQDSAEEVNVTPVKKSKGWPIRIIIGVVIYTIGNMVGESSQKEEYIKEEIMVESILPCEQKFQDLRRRSGFKPETIEDQDEFVDQDYQKIKNSSRSERKKYYAKSLRECIDDINRLERLP